MMLLLLARRVDNRRLLLKAHISGYVKQNGTFVVAHEDGRVRRWCGDDRHHNEIMEAVRASPYGHHALRVMSPHPHTGDAPDVKEGDTLGASHVWDDGESTDDELDGTSGLGIKGAQDIPRAIKLLGHYWGRQVVLMGSHLASDGADDGERVLKKPKVMAVWHRKKEGLGRGIVASHADWDEA